MLLSDSKISGHIKAGNITITPFDEASIQPNSYDLHLGTHIIRSTTGDIAINPYDKDSVNEAFIDLGNNQEFQYRQNNLYLCSTVETISLPDHIAGQVFGKSSLARLGISIHETAGFIDAGFSGQITLEITNKHPTPVILQAGMPIAQIAFFECMPCQLPYNKRTEAKYNGQVGATMSKYYLNR